MAAKEKEVEEAREKYKAEKNGQVEKIKSKMEKIMKEQQENKNR